MQKVLKVILILFFSLSSTLFAKQITIEEAKQVAVNWMTERSNYSLGNISIREFYSVAEENIVLYYIFNFTPSGFTIVSGDDITYPVIGYSFNGEYNKDKQPPAFKEWMGSIKSDIHKAIEQNLEPSQKLQTEWKRLKADKISFKLKKAVEINQGGPLVTAEWNQDWPYNKYCPEYDVKLKDYKSYNNHCAAGCVAIAMSQVMRSHEYPRHGRSNHSYSESENTDKKGNVIYPSQGTLSADFGNTNYDWNQMPDKLSTLPIIGSSEDQINSVSTLIYQSGISVDMDYGPPNIGSGASPSRIRNALVNFFDYSIETTFIKRGKYNTSTQWIALMKNEINEDRSVLYGGYYHTSHGTSGHRFVLDGYQGESHFHFNWGWGGALNGYFYLDKLNPGKSEYNDNQNAVINIDPVHDSQIDDDSPVLFIYQHKWESPSNGGKTDPIYVINSNPLSTDRIDYSISSSETWLTVNAENGKTVGSFIITSEPNHSGNRRTGEITVETSDASVFNGSSVQKVFVTQPSIGETHAVDIVFVIDRSGSMGNKGYMEPAKTAAKTFVDFMQTNDNVAVVSFSDYATANDTLTKIINEQVKIDAKHAIDLIYSNGATSIGAGIRNGQYELNKGRTSVHQAMILLSDGEENRSPYWKDIQNTIPENTDIYTIALGPESDINLLTSIASQTGGDYSYAPEAAQLQTIYNYIRGAITDYKTFVTNSATLNPGSTESFIAPVDGLTSDVQFSVTYSAGNIDMNIVTPSGTLIDSSVAKIDTNITYLKGSNFCLIKVKEPQSGTWKQIINGQNLSASTDFNASVQGISELKQEPFLDKSQFEVGQPIIISTIITANKTPVKNADVRVEIQSPNSNMSEKSSLNSDENISQNGNYQNKKFLEVQFSIDSLMLYDDGQHSDGAKDDGLYANVYTNTEYDGNYTFTISASGSIPGSGQFQRENSFSAVVMNSSRPPVPNLLAVDNGINDVPLNPILKWENVYGGYWYEFILKYFQRGSQSTNSVTLIDTLISADSIQVAGLENGKTYFWKVRAINSSRIKSEFSELWSFTTSYLPSMENICFPNPFNPSLEDITIRFRLEKSSFVKCKIYDASSMPVLELSGNFKEGTNEIEWNGKKEDGAFVSNGIYFYVIEPKKGKKRFGKIAVLR